MMLLSQLLFIVMTRAARVELDVTRPPFVYTAYDNAPLSWSLGATACLLHQNSLMEINVDGARFVPRRRASSRVTMENSSSCVSAKHSLCAFTNSYVLASDITPVVTITKHQNPMLALMQSTLSCSTPGSCS